MRKTLGPAFALSLVVAPAMARADIGGCFGAQNELNRCSVSGEPAAILAALAAPVLIAGAAATVAHELHRRTEERDASAASGATAAPATGKHAAPSLALVPDPPDPYRVPAGRPERHAVKPSGAFQFNETATNVATVVTGAAVVGAIVGTIVSETRHK